MSGIGMHIIKFQTMLKRIQEHWTSVKRHTLFIRNRKNTDQSNKTFSAKSKIKLSKYRERHPYSGEETYRTTNRQGLKKHPLFYIRHYMCRTKKELKSATNLYVVPIYAITVHQPSSTEGTKRKISV